MRQFLITVLSLLATAHAAAPTTAPTSQPDVTPQLNLAVDQWTFPKDANGFSLFPMSTDARIVYISAGGSDSNSGLSPDLPIRTLRRAFGSPNATGFAGNLLRPSMPDRLRFKRGDVFTPAQINNVIQFGGRSASEPLVIERYGTGPRPIIRGDGISIGGRAARFLVICDLDLIATGKDPDAADFDPHRDERPGAWAQVGINLNSAGQYLWIENCRLRYFWQQLCLQGGTGRFSNVVIRRNIIIDAYTTYVGHSQGGYFDAIDGLRIEENLLDHNGWSEDPRIANAPPAIIALPLPATVPAATHPTTMATTAPLPAPRILDGKPSPNLFRHNLYIQTGCTGVIVRGNISSRASSHGCQQRPGGLMEDNLYLDNPMAAFVAEGDSIVRRNVIVGGRGIDPANPRGMGLEFVHLRRAIAEGNLLIHKTDTASNQPAFCLSPRLKDGSLADTAMAIRNNIICDWTGPAVASNGPVVQMLLERNTIVGTGSLYGWDSLDLSTAVFRDNIYATLPAKAPVTIARASATAPAKPRSLSLSNWLATAADNSQAAPPILADPARDIAAYAASIGLADATPAGFLAACRLNDRDHFDPRLTAYAANTWLRAGFRRVTSVHVTYADGSSSEPTTKAITGMTITYDDGTATQLGPVIEP
jgi:hypothetical protein